MAFLSINKIACAAPSTITLPLTGRAHADLTLAVSKTDLQQGDEALVEIQGGETYAMTVERVGPVGGFVKVKVIGGTGGLRKDVEPKWYQNASPSLILKELLEECGEVVGDLELPADPLPQWVRPGGPAADALHALMTRFPEHNWQVSPSGKVNAGPPIWQEFQTPIPLSASDPASGVWLIPIVPAVLPGMHVTMTRGTEEFGKRITRVTHEIEAYLSAGKPSSRLRTILGSGDGEDTQPTGAEAVARRALRWVDYLALFPCTVIRDHGDHTLDLLPEHQGLPEMVKVRMLQPIAGARVKLKAGSQVLLQFQQGDPARPLVTNTAMATLEKLELITGKGQQLILDDDRGQVSPEDQIYLKPTIKLEDEAGQKVELWAQKGQERVTVQDKSGQKVELLPNSGKISITANTKVEVNAPTVELAGGGPAVARVGDRIQVTGVMPGSGVATGTIVSGSSKVRSG